MAWNLIRSRRAAWFVLSALLLTAVVLACPDAVHAAAGGEANLKIPDLGQAHVAGLSGRALLTAGLGLTLAGGRLVAGFLTGISPDDPVALTAAAGLLLATTAAAGYLPARRASRLDPMVALRVD